MLAWLSILAYKNNMCGCAVGRESWAEWVKESQV